MKKVKGNTPALVGIVPRKSLWPRILKEHWYHIPVESAPKNVLGVEYIAFYFPKCFGEKLKYQVYHYAPVLGVDKVKRINLFPEQIKHPKKNKDYYQFHLGEIKTLAKPIPSQRWRRIVHISTSLKKLLAAKEINDLYDTSPLEDKMYQALKKRKINPERQYFVNFFNTAYCLDFALFCKKGQIDLECDGDKYHSSPKKIAYDRMRNNYLTSAGWHVLRFSGNEIEKSMPKCLNIIGKTITLLKG
jgi:very-short-patch-repair endonuclease